MRNMVRRHCLGNKNGMIPSNKKISPNATALGCSTGKPASLPGGLCGSGTGAGSGSRPRILEISEEFGIGIDHHHVGAVLEAGAISFETAVELEILGILSEGLRINLRCLAVAVAAYGGGVAGRFG